MNWAQEQTDNTKMHKRLVIVRTAVLVMGLAIFIQLINLQVVQSEDLASRGLKQHQTKTQLPPRRGHILDRNGLNLTQNLDDYISIGVNPSDITDRKRFAKDIAKVTGRPTDYFINRLTVNLPYIYLIRKIPPEQAVQIKALGWQGLRYVEETRRIYPHAQRAGQVLGFVGMESAGLGGVELTCNDALAGTPGWRMDEVDASRERYRYYDENLPFKPAVDGADVVLTIDYAIQAILEDELATAMKSYQAIGAAGIIMDPRSGEILAMASLPAFNPNRYSEYKTGTEKNVIMTNMYEPGSTFKLVGAAYLLDKGQATLATTVNTSPGYVMYYGHKISDHGSNYGVLTLRQTLAKSSNIGMIKLTAGASSDGLYDMMRKFGFGMSTGVELPGEEQGIVPLVKNWSGLTKPNIVIGQGVAVTMLQLATAYGAVANGGKLMKPMLIRERHPVNGAEEITEPKMVRQVISPRTASLLTECFRDVVDVGTATTAKIPGMPVAGKTGTAQKPDAVTKGYADELYIASFVGYFPAETPRYLVLITVDEPNGVHYGGSVAAPVFKNVAERILGRQPELWRLVKGSRAYYNNQPVKVPDVSKDNRATALKKIFANGLQVTTVGKGDVIYDQYPAANGLLKIGGSVVLVLGPARTKQLTVTPYLSEQSLRDAIQKASKAGLYVNASGSGRVLRQDPPAGTVLPSGRKIVIIGEES